MPKKSKSNIKTFDVAGSIKRKDYQYTASWITEEVMWVLRPGRP
jgi:hypothetical protein